MQNKEDDAVMLGILQASLTQR